MTEAKSTVPTQETLDTSPMDGLPTQEQLLSMSGLEFMQSFLTGEIQSAPIGKTMNFAISEVEDGKVAFKGTPLPRVSNPMRSVHGGWYGTILDSCMGCAVMTKVPKGSYYTTLEFKVNIIRPIPMGRTVLATGVVQHAGRRTGVATGEIRDIETNKLYASGMTTCAIMQA